MICRYIRNNLTFSWDRYRRLKVTDRVFVSGPNGESRSFSFEEWDSLPKKEPIPDKKMV